MSQYDALVIKFARVLPNWLRRCGVRRADLDDAVQEASLEVLEKLGPRVENGLTEAQVRHELMRIVSNVALRVRRRLQRESDRHTAFEPASEVYSRDEEAWVETRALVLMALENLDEPTRALIYAHEIEGRTNVEIAAWLSLKEDTVEKRVHLAKQRLRSEVEFLERAQVCHREIGREVGREKETLLAGGLLWQLSDPFDRALFGAAHEVWKAQPSLSGLPKAPGRSFFVRPNMPTTALMGALVFAPMVPTNSAFGTVPDVKRISSFELPPIVPRQTNTISPGGRTETNVHTQNVLRDALDAQTLVPGGVAPETQGKVRPPELADFKRMDSKVAAKHVEAGQKKTPVPKSFFVSESPGSQD